MAIASITQWLNSPDKNYLQGRLLYEQYGNNRVTLALISSGSGSYHLSKLITALADINSRPEIKPQQIAIAKVVAVPMPVVKASKEAIDYKDAPQLILDIRAQKTENYATARKLHESIRFIESKEHRCSAGLQILDLMDEVSEAWGIIDEWKEKGHVRAVEQKKQMAAVSEMSHLELLQEEKRLAPNVTKDRKKLLKPLSKRKELDIQVRLQERSIRLEEVRRRINEFV
jgi:hypothetical protein